MEKFNEIQSLWNQQPTNIPKLEGKKMEEIFLKRIKKQKSRHLWTIGILTSLILVLIYFYYAIFSKEIGIKFIGLELMILVIVLRVILEIVSIVKFIKINCTESFKNYSEQLMSFYKFRKGVHLILTPIIYLLYFVGFISLLPHIKENVSKGFFIYILFSGIIFLLFFSYFLRKIVLKDLSDLTFLNKTNEAK